MESFLATLLVDHTVTSLKVIGEGETPVITSLPLNEMAGRHYTRWASGVAKHHDVSSTGLEEAAGENEWIY